MERIPEGSKKMLIKIVSLVNGNLVVSLFPPPVDNTVWADISRDREIPLENSDEYFEIAYVGCKDKDEITFELNFE